MNIEILNCYINYGISKNQSYKQLLQGLWGINIFALIGSIFGLYGNSRTLLFSILIYCFAIISTIFSYYYSYRFKSTKYDEYKYILLKTILSLNGSLVFILDAMIFYELVNANIIYLIILSLFPILIILFSILIDYFNIKKGKFSNLSNIKRINLRCYATAGAIVGFWIARVLLSNISQNQANIVLVLIFLFLSFVFSFGGSNLLRLYYYRKTRLQTES